MRTTRIVAAVVATQQLSPLLVTALVYHPSSVRRFTSAVGVSPTNGQNHQLAGPSDSEKESTSLLPQPDTDLVVRYRNRSRLLESTLRHKVQALQLSDQKLHVLEDAIQRLMRRTTEQQDAGTTQGVQELQSLVSQLAETQQRLQDRETYWGQQEAAWLDQTESLKGELSAAKQQLEQDRNERKALELANESSFKNEIKDIKAKAREREARLREQHATERTEWQATLRQEVRKVSATSTEMECRLRKQLQDEREEWEWLEQELRADTTKMLAKVEQEQTSQVQQKESMEKLQQDLDKSKAEEQRRRELMNSRDEDWRERESALQGEVWRTQEKLAKVREELATTRFGHSNIATRDDEYSDSKFQENRNDVMAGEREQATHWEQLDQSRGEAWWKTVESDNYSDQDTGSIAETGRTRLKTEYPDRVKRKNRSVATTSSNGDASLDEDENLQMRQGHGRVRRLASRVLRRPRNLVGWVLRRNQQNDDDDDEDDDGPYDL